MRRSAARPAACNAGNFHRGPRFFAQLEASAMADSTASFEADVIGAAPKGWTATKTGKGDAKWTIEQDKTAPSNSKVVKQSGRATYPLTVEGRHRHQGWVRSNKIQGHCRLRGSRGRSRLAGQRCEQLLRGPCQCARGQRRALQDRRRRAQRT